MRKALLAVCYGAGITLRAAIAIIMLPRKIAKLADASKELRSVPQNIKNAVRGKILYIRSCLFKDNSHRVVSYADEAKKFLDLKYGPITLIQDEIRNQAARKTPLIALMAYWFLKGLGYSSLFFLKRHILTFNQPFRLYALGETISPIPHTKKILNYYTSLVLRRISIAKTSCYPAGLDIEPARLCHLKCPLCPLNDDKLKLDRGKMQFLTFKRLMDEAGNYVFFVDFCYWGEPLLNEELPAFINYAKKYKIMTVVRTSMNNLDEKLAEELVLSGTDCIMIGFSTLDKKMYSAYTKTGDLERVRENVEKVLKYRERHKRIFPRIYGYLFMTRDAEENLDAYKKIAVDYYKLDGLYTGYFVPFFYLEAFDRREDIMKEYSCWIPRNEKSTFFDDHGKPTYPIKTCFEIWSHPAVDFKGNIYPCWCVAEEKNAVGNINNDTFKDIWNGPKIKKYREFLKKGTPNDPSIPCSHCLYLSKTFSGENGPDKQSSAGKENG